MVRCPSEQGLHSPCACAAPRAEAPSLPRARSGLDMISVVSTKEKYTWRRAPAQTASLRCWRLD